MTYFLDPLNSWVVTSVKKESGTGADMALDAPSHFFSDCIDLDSEPYPGAYTPEQDEQANLGQYHTTLPPSITDSAVKAEAYSSTSDQIIVKPYSFTQGPAMSFPEDSFNPSLCDPALLASSVNPLLKAHKPLTPASSARASITTRSSTSSIAQGDCKSATTALHTPPDSEEPPKKRRASRKARASTADEEDDKRKKFLEKNRIAASKCRQKKKVFVSELEQTKIDLERQNAHLHVEFITLLNDVSRIKNELMLHAGCKDPNIDRWFEVEARKFVQASADRAENHFAQPVGHGLSHNHGHSGSLDSAYSFPDTEPRNSLSRRGSMDYSHSKLTLQ